MRSQDSEENRGNRVLLCVTVGFALGEEGLERTPAGGVEEVCFVAAATAVFFPVAFGAFGGAFGGAFAFAGVFFFP